MKNLKLILLAIVVSLAGVSCSSDDDNNNNNNGSSSNSMNIGGVEFDIASAFLQGYGENEDGSYDWDVVFLGEGLTVNSQAEEVEGSGATLYIDLNTNNPDGLRAGTYTFSPNYEREEFTWVSLEACNNFESNTCQSGLSFSQNGTVVITGSGSNTTIEVTVTDNNGATITANYTGGFVYL